MIKKINSQIVFINEASSLIGMGHILRSQTIARIINNRGYSVIGITIGDEQAISYAKLNGKINDFDWQILSASNIKEVFDILLFIKKNLILIDCNNLNENFINEFKKYEIPIIALDYFNDKQPLPSAIINLIDHNPSAINGIAPNRDGANYFEGPNYAIIRDEFINIRKKINNYPPQKLVKKIVISFGGADPTGNTETALKKLSQWPSHFLVDVIIGPLFQIDLLTEKSNRFDNCEIQIHKAPSHIGEIFKEADLLFCGGGGTLLEAICAGIPAVVIAQNESELRHAKYLAKLKACWILEDIKWQTVNSLKNRKEKRKFSQKCIDGLGAQRISDIIENNLK